MQQGIAHAEKLAKPADYLLLTDADIEYPPAAVTRLVARAKASRTVLTSLMVRLNCESLAERALIPAFVFFFQMLYPFAWVNRHGREDRCRCGRLHAGRTPTRSLAREASPSIRARADRRLRACATDEGGRTDLARPEPTMCEPQILSSYWRYPPHGRPLGLCPTSIIRRLLLAAPWAAWR